MAAILRSRGGMLAQVWGHPTGQTCSMRSTHYRHSGVEAWSEHVGQKVANAMETLFGTPIICPVLIGRATDLATLHLLIEQAKGGRGHVALISGEAGIGKSRLVAEAKTYAATH